ncbi:MAG: helicase-exonuclease AddAB subunit AddA [Clostridia bacterium]|nr:helicase-exonuclease AddAB subunit AddA [Clostridia bacterium]
MNKSWTPSQEKAVEARGMQVLVSAAAGSGKTTVLTERVKNILSDIDNPCSVSEILVVTFTRAAATEMRDRIYDALKELCSIGSGGSDYLRRQMMLLPTADICTIDSFCAKIVRENFSKADVGVDFKILDEKDIAEIMHECLETVINELYDENDESFRALTTMFLNERDDRLLGEVIETLYNYSRSYPSPEKWLEDLAASFSCEKGPDDTIWADTIYKFVGMFCDYYYKRLNRCVALMEDSGGFSPDYLRRFTLSADNVLLLKNAVDNRDWNGLVLLIREGLVVKIPARNSKVDEELKKMTQDVFAEFEDDAEGLVKRMLPTTDEHKCDSERLYPIVGKLCDAVKRLTSVLSETKKELNSYTFDDILHKCIDLLIEFGDGDEWSLTPVGETLRSKYKEILIDEYQDTNEAQNIIFEALSDNCRNLYCVGDVKQSIYRFRLASPELFMKLRRNLPGYDGEIHPSQITLDKNFRSREGIDKAVNYVFKTLMSREIGEIDYDEREELAFGADYYPEKNSPDTEIICIDANGMKAAEATLAEADVVADYIKRVLDSGVTVTTKKGVRPVRASDICVLLRSVKNKVKFYTDALEKRGINSSAVLDGDISDSKEILLLGSLIKAINNPLLDVSMISVLLSPVFGFTADEVSEIRMIDRNADLFICLEKYAENSVKAKHFLKKLSQYRNASSALPVDEFVKYLIDDTGVTDIFLSMPDGDMRRANLRGFIRFAEDFTKSGRIGLNAFVRYFDNAVENGSLHSHTSTSVADGVSFMSIHKSKGLEFPYVIIADCAKGFNKQDSHKSLLLSRETGIGLKIRDDELFSKYHTVSSAATEKSVLFGTASEELRVLYVAMTRAKEHLTFVCSITGKSLGKRVKINNTLSFDSHGRLHPYAVYKASSVCEWILTCFAKHKDCGIIRDIAGYKCSVCNGEGFSIDTSFVDASDDLTDNLTEDDVQEFNSSVDFDLLNEICERTEYSYEYDCSGIVAKIAASATENKKIHKSFFINKKPMFLTPAFTGALKGTAVHKFLELCDFHKASLNPESEMLRLKENGSMTEKELEVLDFTAVKKFFNSSIGERLLESDTVYKEYEFSFLKKAGDIYNNLTDFSANEDVVIQGKFDCAFIENGEAVLIDYKTDNITDENVFRELYSPQLQVYADALMECEGIRVKEKYLYSFKLKKFIEI